MMSYDSGEAISRVYTLRLADEDMISLRPSEVLAQVITTIFKKYPSVKAIDIFDDRKFHYERDEDKQPELTDFAGRLHNGEKIKIEMKLETERGNAEDPFRDFDAFFERAHSHAETLHHRRLKPYRN